MIEKTVLDYLSEKLSVGCYMEVPEGNSTDFIVIEKTGSSEENEVKSAMIAIQSYGKTLHDAASLNEQVKTAMKGILSLDSVSDCSLNSDYNFTNTLTKQYRYQAVFDITHY